MQRSAASASLARVALSVVALCVVILCVAASPASAQQWATKMFNTTDHDFGAVARGSDTVYRFEIKNIYKEDIHIASVRSSCGCTTPSIENNLIKTYEKAYVVAKFNTRTFTGLHSATLTVTIDRPYPAQVQLRVHGNIRGDVVFQPGSVNFDSVEQGAAAEKTVSVTYAGRSGWEITDVRSASSDLEVEMAERPRSRGRAAYNLLVRLKPTATPGFLKEQLVLVTNDHRNPRIPLDIEGRIIPEISVAPLNLVLGETPAGETIKKRLIVRGKQPFRVTAVTCESEGFSFKTDETARDRHIINVEYTPPAGDGTVKAPIVVETDLGESYTATCTAYATLQPASAEEPPTAEPPTGEVATGEVATGEVAESDAVDPDVAPSPGAESGVTRSSASAADGEQRLAQDQ